jgi:ABC-type transport system involved in multi-copper enzyme maturation permease subunit
MLATIIKKEILENIFSYRFPLFLIICGVLIPLGIYVNKLDYTKRIADYNEQSRLASEAVSSSQMQDVMAGTMNLKGFRPPSPLSVFAQGFENTFPRFYEFKQGGYKAGETSVRDESVLSVQGKFDFLFILQMIISLIVLLFASDVIAGEKELGTLRGIFSNSMPRDTLLLGKIIGGFLSVWIPFVVAFLAGILVLMVTDFPTLTGDIPVKIFFIFSISSLFILTYYSLGIMISASAHKTRTSLVMILLLWGFLQLIAPKMSDMVASFLHPVRTETALSLEKSLITSSSDDELAKELGRQYIATFGSDEMRMGQSQEETPEQVKWDGIKKGIEQKYHDLKTQQLNAIDESYRHEKSTQEAIAINLSFFSPSAAFARLLTDICATGDLEKTKYLTAVVSHQAALDDELFGRVKRTMMKFPNGKTALSFSAEPVNFKSLPNFSINPTSLRETFKADWESMLSLIFWLIAPFAVAYVRFLRYDVR